MKLVLTLLARDEADVVDANLAFHLSAGVDFVVATDNRSRDGTTEILESYAREGVLHLVREDSTGFDQSAWVTRMAQLAAGEFGADWVINSDADEFWWPRGGDLKEVLAAMPPRFGILRAPIRHFFLRLGGDAHFAERLVVRPLLSAPVNEPGNPLRPNTHVLHRGDPAAVVTAGNHALRGSAHVRLPGWYPIECLHFPDRSIVQADRKYRNWVDTLAGREYRDAFEARERGQLDDYVRAKVLPEDVVERGLADGSLVIDTRLRDALRTLAGVEPLPASVELARATARLAFPRPSVEEDVAYAAETAVLGEADAVRLQRRLDELEPRLARLERRRPLARVRIILGRSRALAGRRDRRPR
jgi:Glycosyl transferase family 2